MSCNCKNDKTELSKRKDIRRKAKDTFATIKRLWQESESNMITTNNFNAGNVYTVTMDFFDEKGKLLIDHEVSYYYAVNLGGGE